MESMRRKHPTCGPRWMVAALALLQVVSGIDMARGQVDVPPPRKEKVPVATAGADLSVADRVRWVLRNPRDLVAQNALFSEVAAQDLLAVTLDLWANELPADQDTRARLLGMLVGAAGRAKPWTPEQTDELAQLCRELLGNPADRRQIMSLVFSLPPELQVTCLGGLLDALQADDWEVVRTACRVLGRMGPSAEEALPALRSVLERETTHPAALAPATEGPFLRPPPRHALHEALWARMKLSGDMAIDAELMPRLGPEGREAAALAVAKAAGMTSGRFDGVPEHAVALTDYYLDWLRSRGDLEDLDFVGLSLAALISDAAEDVVRERALDFVRELAARRDDPCASAFGGLLSPHETICSVEVPPPRDPREVAVLRKMGGLADLAEVDGRWLAVSVSPCSTMLDEHTPDTAVAKLWDVESGAELARLVDDALVATFCGQGDEMVVVSPVTSIKHAVRDVRLWKPGEPPRMLAKSCIPAVPFRQVALGGMPRFLTLDKDGTLELFEPRSQETVRSEFWRSDHLPQLIGGSADGSRLVLGDTDRRLRILDARTLEVVATLSEPEAALAAALGDAFVAGPPPGYRERYGKPPAGPMPTSALFARDGASLFCADHWGALVQRALPTGEVLRIFATSGAFASALELSPDGRLLVTSSGGIWTNGQRSTPDDFVVRIFDVETGEERAQFTGMQAPATVLRFSADGHQLAALSMWSARVWDLPEDILSK